MVSSKTLNACFTGGLMPECDIYHAHPDFPLFSAFSLCGKFFSGNGSSRKPSHEYQKKPQRNKQMITN